MLNYGSSITSSFPNSFCTSPANLTCQLCNKSINESAISSLQQSLTKEAGLFRLNQYSFSSRLEKCIHCGINICEKCFNENQEKHLNENENIKKSYYNNGYSGSQHNNEATSMLNESQSHYNAVKKEFKQMYNYSKEIVEKLHLLSNAIKVEESAVSELNSIKHQVNMKALELIKQINQEKNELVEQIEKVKTKYES
jgi:hypothetical protein